MAERKRRKKAKRRIGRPRIAEEDRKRHVSINASRGEIDSWDKAAAIDGYGPVPNSKGSRTTWRRRQVTAAADAVLAGLPPAG